MPKTEWMLGTQLHRLYKAELLIGPSIRRPAETGGPAAGMSKGRSRRWFAYRAVVQSGRLKTHPKSWASRQAEGRTRRCSPVRAEQDLRHGIRIDELPGS